MSLRHFAASIECAGVAAKRFYSRELVARTLAAFAVAVFAMMASGIVCANGSGFYLVQTIASQHKEERVRATFTRLQRLFDRLQQASGTRAELYFSPTREINAFATFVNGKPVVAVYGGLLDAVGRDEAALAATLAHELGHIKYRHPVDGAQAQALIQLIAGLAGLAIDINQGRKGNTELVGLGALGARAGSTLAFRAYTRDQEREADRESVAILFAADLDPEGAIRMQELLARRSSSVPLLFSSHPPGPERVSNMREQVAMLQPQLNARRAATLQAEATRREEAARRAALEEEKSKQDQLERTALHTQATKDMAEKSQTAAAQANALTAGSAKAQSRGTVEATNSRCADSGANKRTCFSTTADGRAMVEKCEKTGEAWICKSL